MPEQEIRSPEEKTQSLETSPTSIPKVETDELERTRNDILLRKSELSKIEAIFSTIGGTIPAAVRGPIFNSENLHKDSKQFLIGKGLAEEHPDGKGGLLWTQEGIRMFSRRTREAMYEALDKEQEEIDRKEGKLIDSSPQENRQQPKEVISTTDVREATTPEIPLDTSRAETTKEENEEIMQKAIIEALETFQTALDGGDNKETAISKGIQKINELLHGEFDDLAVPAAERFIQELEKRPEIPPPAGLPVEQSAEQGPKAKSMEEIREDVRKLDEMVRETEENAKSRVQAALDVLHGLIDEAEQAGLNVVKYRNIIANVIPRDYMRDIDGFLSGPDKPVLMTADNFEEYKTKYETIVTNALAFIEKTRTDFLLDKMEQIGAKSNPDISPIGPIRPTETPTESTEANKEKLNQAVEQAVAVFQEELKNGGPERARDIALIDFNNLTREIENTGDENVAASEKLQARLEELMLAEKAKETGEIRLDNVVAACMETYRNAIDSGRSVSQAEEASMQKFVELIKGIKNTDADANTVSSLMGELRNKWQESEAKVQPSPTMAKENKAAAEMAEGLEPKPTREPSSPEPAPEPKEPPSKEEPEKSKVETRPLTMPERVKAELTEFGLTQEDMAEIGFDKLSEGRQLLILDNLKQITLGQIQETALEQFRENTKESKFFGRVWRGITKEYQIAKLQKTTAEEIKGGGLEAHGEVLSQLVSRAEFGPDAVVGTDGKLEVRYLDQDGLDKRTGEGEIALTLEEWKKVDDFNRVATEFRRLPYEWSISRAKGGEGKEFDKKQEEFRKMRIEMLNLLADKIGGAKTLEYMSQIEGQIRMDQFISSNPDVEKALLDVENPSFFKSFISGTGAERVGLMVGGGIVRSATVSLFGLAAAPVVAAGIGAYRARQRANETIRQELKSVRAGGETELTRKIKTVGGEEKDVDLLSFVDAEQQYKKLEDLTAKVREARETGDEEESTKLRGRLESRLHYVQLKLEQGQINFGENRLFNQYDDLIGFIAEAEAEIQMGESEQRVSEETGETLDERLEQFLSYKDKQVDKYVWKQAAKGAGISAAFAIGGWLARHFAGEILSADTSGSIGFSEKHKADFEALAGINSADGISLKEAERIAYHVNKFSKDGYSDAAIKLLGTYSDTDVQGTGKTVKEYLTEAATDRKDQLAALRGPAETFNDTTRELYAKHALGIDIKDGVTEDKARKIAEHIRNLTAEGKTDAAKTATESFKHLQTTDTHHSVEELINQKPEIVAAPVRPEPEPIPSTNVESYRPTSSGSPADRVSDTPSSPGPSEPAPRPSPEPSPRLRPEVAPTGRKEFSNLILGDQDSIWASTEDTFRLYRTELGYDPARDGDVEEWARRKTAEVINELAKKEYGGKIPDLVHDNDRVVVSIGEDGKPHLRFENTSGLKTGFLEKEIAPKPTAANLGASLPSGSEAPSTETHPLTWQDYQKTYESLSYRPEDILERHHVVRQYLMDKRFEQIRNSTGFTPEKINVFARMFGGDWAGLSPEHLKTTLESFDGEMRQWTQKLVGGELNDSLVKYPQPSVTPFPIETKDGKVFYAEWQTDGKWKLYQMDESDQVGQVTDKGFLGRNKDRFDFKEVRKMLGY